MKTQKQATLRLTNYQRDVLHNGMASINRVYEDEPVVYEYIVQAVNSHEELLEIAKAHYDGITDPMRKVIIGRIIAKAEGK